MLRCKVMTAIPMLFACSADRTARVLPRCVAATVIRPQMLRARMHRQAHLFLPRQRNHRSNHVGICPPRKCRLFSRARRQLNFADNLKIETKMADCHYSNSFSTSTRTRLCYGVGVPAKAEPHRQGVTMSLS